MTLQEIDQLVEDTRRSPRVENKMEQTTALGILEVARQLAILNEHLAAQSSEAPKAKAKSAGKK